MKFFLTASCLLLILLSKAQIVNIPDANFKNYLINAGVDLNANGEIETSEAEAVISFPDYTPVGNNRITDFTGIKSFVNMQNFTVTHDIANSNRLDLDDLPNLKRVVITYPGMTYINLAGSAALKSFYISPETGHPNTASVNVSGCTALDSLTWKDPSPVLHFLTFENTNFRFLDLTASNFNRLDLTGCDSLTTFICFEMAMHTLNVSGLKKLNSLKEIWYIDTIFAQNCSSLTEIDTRFSSIPIGGGPQNGNFIYVDGCTNLRDLRCNLLDLPLLDLSTCINLKNLWIEFPTPRRSKYSINLKNGSMLSSFKFQTPLWPVNICADEFEIDSLYSLLVQYPSTLSDFENLNFSSYCSFLPGGNYNTIKGNIKVDENNNGCDSLDRGINNVAIKITDTSGNTFIRYTSSSGDYVHYPYKGVFTLTPYFPYPFYNVTPVSSIVSFDTANSLVNTTNFCIQPDGIHNDLEITFLPTRPVAKPGYNAGYTLVYKNRGTTTLSGNVQLNFDNSRMSFISASENVSAQSAGQLLWNYNNLHPFESRTIDVTFNLLPPPVNFAGDTIYYLSVIDPSDNDETAFDNSFTLPQLVRDAFDPNDKECLEGNKLDISKIGDYLHYQIHFQNVGNDTAYNIVVVDTLSNKLDWSTLELISSSHPCTVNIKNNKAEFIFENIKLPYKAINEPASNGYVAFKIKPAPSVVVGDSLNNTAAIYFDFNKPVITNRATTVITSASTPVPVKVEYFSLNSRSNANILNWKAACTDGSATFSIERSKDGIHFSSIGNLTATTVRCQLPFNFTDNNPVEGKNYYRLKITDADGISFFSKVLVTGNSKAGLQITAVTGNVIYIHSNKPQTVSFKIIAADGKTVYTDRKYISGGNTQINLQTGSRAKGIYTMVVYTTEGDIITKRFAE